MRGLQGVRWLALSGAALLPAAAMAQQQQQPEEIVVQASRLGARLADIPRSITVLPQAEIEQQMSSTTDLGQMLARTVPGLPMSLEGRFNSQGQNTIRGRRLQVVLDGVVMNTNVLDFNNEFLATSSDTVRQIEVIRGGTAVYGFGATGGIVAITSKKPTPTPTPVFTSKIQISSQPADLDDSLVWNLYQDAQFSAGAFDFRFTGSQTRRHSRFDAQGDRIPVPGAASADNTRERTFTVAMAYNFLDQQRLEVSMLRYDIVERDRWGSTGGSFLTNTKAQAINLIPGVQDQATMVSLGGFVPPPVSFGNDMYKVTYDNPDVFGSKVNVIGYYQHRPNVSATLRIQLVRPAPTQTVIGYNTPEQTRHGARATIDTPLDRLLGLEAGSNLNWGLDHEKQRFTQPNSVTDPASPDVDIKSWAPFGQAQLKFFNGRLTLSGGMRYEANEATIPDFRIQRSYAGVGGNFVQGGTLNFNKWIPNAGAVFDLVPGASLFASYAQGFTVGEILRVLRNTTAPSVNRAVEAEPVVVDNYELGVRGTIDNVRYSLSGFFSESELGATFQQDPVTLLSYIERAPEKIWGAEATLDFRLPHDMTAGGTASWQEGIRRLNGDWRPLPGNRIAPIKITGYFETPLASWLRLRLDAMYGGSRNKFAPTSTAAGEGDVGALFLLDAALFAELPVGSLSFGVQNLLNRQYIPQGVQAANNNDYTAGAGTTMVLTYRVVW